MSIVTAEFPAAASSSTMGTYRLPAKTISQSTGSPTTWLQSSWGSPPVT
ncbi:MAG TPA: hypothetical protein VF815_24760 [Myxococcaceae bacterium]